MKKHLMLLGLGAVLLAGGYTLVKALPNEAPARDEAPPRTASSKIVQVTVYPNSALVTRQVEVPAGQGTLELVVNPLPQHTVNSSLYSEGSDGIRVLTTRFRTRPVKEDTREEVRKLEDEAKKLRQLQEKLQAESKALEQNMALLGKLETFTSASTTHATEKGKLDSDATITLAKYLMEGRSTKVREQVELQQQMQNNTEQMQFVARKLQELTAGSSKTERDAVIVVDKANNAPGKVRLNYLVDTASWRPQYKVRAGSKAEDPVQIEYLAAIVQQSGEDWQGVEMILSTAQPMLNATPPELKILAVNVVPRNTPVAANQPAPQPPGQALAIPQGGGMGGVGGGARQGPITFANPSGNTTIKELNDLSKDVRQQAQLRLNRKGEETAGNELWNYAGALEQARDLVLSLEETHKGKGTARAGQNEGPSVTYHLNSRLTVPSRNDEQVIEVARIDMAPDYFYKAVPILTPHIYRQANLVNKTKYVLLHGEATMYHDKDFVGRMNLPLVAVGEQFTVGFGTEPQLQVQRQMMDKSRTMQGGNQVLKFEYRILVSSYKPEKVKVQLWDRLPSAENETMGVTLVKASPEISSDAMYVREERPNNLLRWDLDIAPETSGEKAHLVKYEFKLELDRQSTIGSFQSK
jgi:hypothetical protein